MGDARVEGGELCGGMLKDEVLQTINGSPW
jgi:hypothetical protein